MIATLEWQEIGTIFADAGDVGGDVQVGPSFSRRFQYGPVEGRWLIVDDYTFAAEWGDPMGRKDEDAMPYAADEMNTFMIVTDPEDPGGTEIDTWVEYGDDGRCFSEIEEATKAAKELLERSGTWMFEHYDPTNELREGRIHQ